MVFNSLTFILFLAVTLFFYYRLRHKSQNLLLLVASYVFYGWWDVRFAFLLLATSFLDFYFAVWIDQAGTARRRKLFLASSIVLNMGVLCVFKYFNFFADSLEVLLRSLGLNPGFPTLHVVLPVGISFYTFLSMSYTIDVYRKEMKATREPVDFLLYVCFFPHLVAGPIVRASYLLPQCQAPRVIKHQGVVNGSWLILLGMVKKVVIADQLAPIVNWGFSGGMPPLNDLNSWLIVYAFAFQIYGDFSGYSDIARGVSKLMGFELVENFRAPYLVTNPSAFWRHWHISLSTWLRDYLYIPLGGNRKGPARTYANLMATMLLGGLWHGAGAAYLAWGLYHGALLAVHRWWSENISRKPAAAGPVTNTDPGASSRKTLKSITILQVIVFFHVTCIGWLLFRAGAVVKGVSQMEVVRNYLHAMVSFSFGSGLHPVFQAVAVLGGLGLFFQWKYQTMDHFADWPVRWKVTGVVSALFLIAALGVFEGSQFIYFQF